MWAAVRLRLLEARRRGGLLPAILAFVAVAATAVWGGDTVAGRYGLATDLAALLTCFAAVFLGAFPIAVDREKKRASLPGASPVTPVGWALGSGLGAAALASGLGLALYLAAGLGALAGGGIETFAVRGMGDRGTIWLPCPPIRVSPRASRLRLVMVSYPVGKTELGTAASATIEVEGRRYAVQSNRPLVIPIKKTPVVLRNADSDFMLGLVSRKVRALEGHRSFFLNSLLAGVGPSLAAGGLAALGAAAGANLGAPVAALLVALVLALAALKGFVRDTIRFEGSIREKVESGGGHGQGTLHRPPKAARAFIGAILEVLPDLPEDDRTDRVSVGEWTGLHGSGEPGFFLLVSLGLAALLGGLGVHLRRLM